MSEIGLPPHMPGKLFEDRRAVLLPFPGEEARPVGGGGDFFSVWVAEDESYRKLSFTDGGMIFKRPAIPDFHWCFRGAVEVGNLDRSLVLPRKGERKEFVQPTDLTLLEMAMKGVQKRGCLSFLDESETFEGMCQT